MSGGTAANQPLPLLDLDSSDTPVRELFADGWRRRDLLPLLARQHFHGQFRAARLGVLWSAIQPLIRGAVLAVVFTLFVPVDTGDIPYPAFVLTGTTVWSYLSLALTQGTTSIVQTSPLATKVYFPRLMLPAMPAASSMPGFLATLVVVIGLAGLFGVAPSVRLLAVPLAIVLTFVLATSAAAVLALLFVYFRDVGQMVTAVVGVAFYITPVIYLPSQAGEYQVLLEANPATGAIALTRWSLLRSDEAILRPVLFTLGWTLALTIIALYSFRKHDRICVDRL